MPARAREIARLGAVALAYFVAGKVGLHFAFAHVNATPVWPPAGIALAAALVLGARAWPAIAVGAFLVNYTTTGSPLSSLGIAAGNTLEALVGAWLVAHHARGSAACERAQDFFKLAALAGTGSTAISATIGVTTLALLGEAPWADYGWLWLTWWLGDAAGVIVVAPALLLWSQPERWAALRQRPAEAALLLLAAVAVGVLSFGGLAPVGLGSVPLSFVCLPVLLWAAFRFGPRETATLVIVLGAIAIRGTLAGHGTFGRTTPNQALLLLQAFMATISLTMLPVAALVWEARRAERAIRASDERLRLTVQAGGMGTWEWTVGDGRVQWSPTLEAIHGRPPATFEGTFDAFMADVHPDDRARVEEAVRSALKRGEHRVEYRIQRPDGSERWVEGRGEVFYRPDGAPERLVGVCMDITDRKRADRRLAFLGEIAHSISASLDLDVVLRRIVDGITALSGSDGAAIFLRDGDAMALRHRAGPWPDSYQTLRIRPGEGLGGQVMVTGRAVRTSDDTTDPRVPPALHPIARAAGPTALMVVPITLGADVVGLLYITRRSAEPFTDEDERMCLRLAEQASIALHNAALFSRVQSAREQAEAASRAKDEFLATLGHELRNPLGAILSAVHVQRVTGPGDRPAAAARDVVERQARHLARLVDDLLDVTRVMTGKIRLQRERLDLGALARRAALVHEPSVHAAGQALAIEAETVWVDGDVTRLEQIVSNLLGNAVKYTPRGGRVALRVRGDGDEAVLTVQDTGVGIPEEILPRVFDLFVQADASLARSAGGLGVGLTLVRRLVELHDGTVRVQSGGPDPGSTFTVRLPAVAAPPPAPPPPAPSPPPVRRRVLVVEDNDDSREMLYQMLVILGHEPHQARDGVEGLEAALRLQPDLILLDVGLPVLDGYEVARRLRREPAGRGLRLVALTGYGQPQDRERARAAGFDVHLVKPVDPDRLRRLLEHAEGEAS